MLYGLNPYHKGEMVYVNPDYVSHVGPYVIDFKTEEAATGVWMCNSAYPLVVTDEIDLLVSVFNAVKK